MLHYSPSSTTGSIVCYGHRQSSIPVNLTCHPFSFSILHTYLMHSLFLILIHSNCNCVVLVICIQYLIQKLSLKFVNNRHFGFESCQYLPKEPMIIKEWMIFTFWNGDIIKVRCLKIMGLKLWSKILTGIDFMPTSTSSTTKFNTHSQLCSLP